MKKYNNFQLHFTFDLKDETIHFLHAEYVHPLKQALIQALQKDFQKDENVRAVILFGSGVEFRCHSYSDLDLCIERYDSRKPFCPLSAAPNEAIDILYTDRIGEKLKKESEEKGIVVYDREGSYV